MTAVSNGSTVPFPEIPILPLAKFRETVIDLCNQRGRIVSFFGWCEVETVGLLAILADGAGTLNVLRTEAKDSYPALTPDCPQALMFEREIHEQTGLIPDSHPNLRPVRFAEGQAGSAPFFRVKGEDVHEVAVGPVHAGIIEPGHFRFQCHGEHVLNLEISLGYQHRGIEEALRGGPDKRTVHYMETVAGDTTIGHATAYAMVAEALAGSQPPIRALALRGVALELERLANHTGDLGALAGDVGYLPTASYCGRLRGECLNLTAALCGSRFGRGLVRPGGVVYDVDAAGANQIAGQLSQNMRDVRGAVDLLWKSPSVMGRFETTGTISRKNCEELGLVGPVARACGLARDVRQDFPAGIYRFLQIPVSVASSGDVFSRAKVRWLELQRSSEFILDQLGTLPGEQHRVDLGPLSPNSLAVSLVEGWARRNLPCRDHRPEWKVPPLQDRGSVLPQLDGVGNGTAGAGDLRLSGLQQEFQSVLLRARPMISVIQARLRQGHRTHPFPDKAPELPECFRGQPLIDTAQCPDGCQKCTTSCPTGAIRFDQRTALVDLGSCLFCNDCVEACPPGAITHSGDYRLAVRRRDHLITDGEIKLAAALEEKSLRLFGRSLKLRQVSAGGVQRLRS